MRITPRTLKQFSQKTHDKSTVSMACLWWKVVQNNNQKKRNHLNKNQSSLTQLIAH